MHHPNSRLHKFRGADGRPHYEHKFILTGKKLKAYKKKQRAKAARKINYKNVRTGKVRSHSFVHGHQ